MIRIRLRANVLAAKLLRDRAVISASSGQSLRTNFRTVIDELEKMTAVPKVQTSAAP